MSRDLTPQMEAALAATKKYVGLLCEIAYPAPLRVWTGRGNLSWDDKLWLGIGRLGNVSAVEERLGTRANQVVLTLSGVPQEQLAASLADETPREVTLSVALFTVDGGGVWSVVPDPEVLVAGETDVHEIVEEDPTATVRVYVDTLMSRLTTLSVLRYTVEDHQRLFPEEEFFEFAESVAEQVLYWPGPEPQRGMAAGVRGAHDDGLGWQPGTGGPHWEGPP